MDAGCHVRKSIQRTHAIILRRYYYYASYPLLFSLLHPFAFPRWSAHNIFRGTRLTGDDLKILMAPATLWLEPFAFTEPTEKRSDPLAALTEKLIAGNSLGIARGATLMARFPFLSSLAAKLITGSPRSGNTFVYSFLELSFSPVCLSFGGWMANREGNRNC